MVTLTKGITATHETLHLNGTINPKTVRAARIARAKLKYDTKGKLELIKQLGIYPMENQSQGRRFRHSNNQIYP